MPPQIYPFLYFSRLCLNDSWFSKPSSCFLTSIEADALCMWKANFTFVSTNYRFFASLDIAVYLCKLSFILPGSRNSAWGLVILLFGIIDWNWIIIIRRELSNLQFLYVWYPQAFVANSYCLFQFCFHVLKNYPELTTIPETLEKLTGPVEYSSSVDLLVSLHHLVFDFTVTFVKRFTLISTDIN